MSKIVSITIPPINRIDQVLSKQITHPQGLIHRLVMKAFYDVSGADGDTFLVFGKGYWARFSWYTFPEGGGGTRFHTSLHAKSYYSLLPLVEIGLLVQDDIEYLRKGKRRLEVD